MIMRKPKESRNSTLVWPELSLAMDLWNPFCMADDQSDILELLFLANPASQTGLMNKLILMPHSTERHSWLSTEDSHSYNLGEPIRILRKYLFQCLTERKTEIFQFRFLLSLFSFSPNYTRKDICFPAFDVDALKLCNNGMQISPGFEFCWYFAQIAFYFRNDLKQFSFLIFFHKLYTIGQGANEDVKWTVEVHWGSDELISNLWGLFRWIIKLTKSNTLFVQVYTEHCFTSKMMNLITMK